LARGESNTHSDVIFIQGDGLTAQGHAQKWFEKQAPVALYLAWDGEVYPKFIAVAERTTNGTSGGIRTQHCHAPEACASCQFGLRGQIRLELTTS